MVICPWKMVIYQQKLVMYSLNKVIFPWKNVIYPRTSVIYPLKIVIYQLIKHADLPVKHGDLPQKKCDFPMKNGVRQRPEPARADLRSAWAVGASTATAALLRQAGVPTQLQLASTNDHLWSQIGIYSKSSNSFQFTLWSSMIQKMNSRWYDEDIMICISSW